MAPLGLRIHANPNTASRAMLVVPVAPESGAEVVPRAPALWSSALLVRHVTPKAWLSITESLDTLTAISCVPAETGSEKTDRLPDGPMVVLINWNLSSVIDEPLKVTV